MQMSSTAYEKAICRLHKRWGGEGEPPLTHSEGPLDPHQHWGKLSGKQSPPR